MDNNGFSFYPQNEKENRLGYIHIAEILSKTKSGG